MPALGSSPAWFGGSSRWPHIFALLAVSLVTASSGANGAMPRVPLPDAVQAVLRSRCVGCHGNDERSGDLRLDSYDAVMRGGERGPVVVPGQPSASLLLKKVLRFDRPPMPPRKPLSATEVRTIRRWIKSGAASW